ncbi:phospholipase D-like domain-containing protein [Primorskyibacter aestuariivivens]|uniref:phospholipase D-like domain-containing protein n=1 Tax=Primorskyibacter aestuariivivens TaxID=1888912 RepID=UPI0022FFCFEC|nr:phospholipase D-like domain-containing protein [Primorskyibacter aestuariivivens]MDA7429313.1 phospholipase D-like domain-containing protein [Primorskyibacter aestuariivivens]
MTLTPLITAAQGFPALERLVSEAREEVFLSFRIFDPETPLRLPEVRARGLTTWTDLLAEVARRGVSLRILLADFDPLFTADLHRLAWRSAQLIKTAVAGDTRVLCAPHGQEAGPLWHLLMRGRIKRALDNLRSRDPGDLTPVEQTILRGSTVLRPVTIHQKFAVADGRVSVIGGLDINERRFDTPDHDRPADETWHDMSMQVTDERFGAALRHHFAQSWNSALDCGASPSDGDLTPLDVAAPERLEDPALVRTLSAPCRGAGRLSPDNRIAEHEETLITAIRDARNSIYLETQFLRHKPIANALVQSAGQNPDLNLIALMPPFAERVLFNSDHGWDARHAHALQVRALARIRDAFGPRAALVAPARPIAADDVGPALHGAEPVYVHSKVTLIDDDFGLVGSANLNGRSLRWDTEASVRFHDPGTVADLRAQLANKWLGEAAKGADITRAATWQEAAKRNARRAPEARVGFVLPYPLEQVQRFSRSLPFLPDDMF